MSTKQKGEKVKNFLQQVKQGPYYLCTISHRSLYQRGVRLFKYENYHMLTADFYPVKSFDEECIYLKLVMSVLIKIKFHIKQSGIKWS